MNAAQQTPNRATLIGAVAILLWSTLAIFTTMTEGIPPFQLLALTFLVAFCISTLILLIRGEKIIRRGKLHLVVWIVSVGGLFGYHFFYFVALRNAPAVEANLINYLWPLLIVVFSSLLPGERLRWFHTAGALLGLSGAFLLVALKGNISFQSESIGGYLAAVACAVIWATYSVLNRRFEHIPTASVSGFCGMTALLAFLCHLVMESWVTPNLAQLFYIILMGLGPLGLAFFVWDYGTKHGDLRLIGVLSYSTPLLSTLLLILFGKAEASLLVLISCTLIIGGALLASKDKLKRAGERATE
ncbi:aromatic amino acid exporter YddG [Sedimenticola selenatireducens]|jgi:drug/metabolite transporter (DMT)-like permease|uniref:EamA family transporter n=1 Tax=Sedimenticola selenatireducens TaxID=191960 RepID=A0A558DME4_9GAMM|nr:EamA family transporter [Sedimenticola selenatireducens]TVO78761.1 EamA family transporter [Sedimenticola selenatireducens]TVT62123.1 MAG: EamA family transporter [Sedimenticola selenatireducens]